MYFLVKMKLDSKTMGYIKVFENYTGASVKDCFISNGVLVFIVNAGNIGRAIGKKGANVRELSGKYKKPIKIFEFSDDVEQFVKNLVYPLKVDVESRDNKIVILCEDNKMKGFICGRDKSKLKEMEDIVKRYYDVEVGVE